MVTKNNKHILVMFMGQSTMMKPDKLYKTKHPTKGEKKNKERGSKFKPKNTKIKESHKGGKEQIMF